MIIKGNLKFSDFRAYQMTFAAPRYLIIFVILSLGFYFFKFGSQFASRIPLPAPAADITISIGLGLLITLFLFASFYIRMRANFSSNPAMKLEQFYEPTGEGINMKGESGEYTLKWDEIKKVSFYRNYILIFSGSSLAMLLPHRFFGSAFDLEEFRTLMNKKVKISNKPREQK